MNPDDWDHEHNFINDFSFRNDTSSTQALLLGTDIQGIKWNYVTSLNRSQYRRERTERYDLYVKSQMSQTEEHKHDVQSVVDDACFYKFRQNCRYASCSLTHFQLRHLIQATSKHDVYVMGKLQVDHGQPDIVDDFCIYHWNALANDTEGNRGIREKVIDLKSQQVLISSMDAMENFVIAGGFKGELACKNVDTGEMIFNKRYTDKENSITNFIQLVRPAYAKNQIQALVSSNDCCVRLFNIHSDRILLECTFPYSDPVNHATLSPCGKMIIIAPDANDMTILDRSTGKKIADLKGHTDYPFATAWHPTDKHVATGAQDKTCKLWDLRMFKSFCSLGGCLGAIRCLKYTTDGSILAAGEPADYVHLYDVGSGYKREQQLDIFGEIVGISFSPDMESFFVGIYDRTYKSLLEFSKLKFSKQIDEALI